MHIYRSRPLLAVALVSVAALAACSSGSSGSAPTQAPVRTLERLRPDAGTGEASQSTASVSSSTTTSAPTITRAAATTALASTSSTTSTSTSTTTSTTTTSTSTTVPLPPDPLESRVLGLSVEGRPISAVRRGTPGGVPVLIIGVIHGNEAAGVAVTDDLLDLPVPDGVDLWIVESMNPDGQLADRRTNANLVDLNRNFPEGWAPLGEPGNGQYAGTGPASEPETQAIVSFIDEIEPMLVIWYHQDLNRIAPAKGRAGEIRQRYADLTGLPVVPITGGTYTGTAAGWARAALPEGGVAFLVELGPTLSADEAAVHAAAVLTIAAEL